MSGNRPSCGRVLSKSAQGHLSAVEEKGQLLSAVTDPFPFM
jgi:hypothetical protein